MKPLILLALFLTIIACEQKDSLPIDVTNDVTEILEAIIIQDSLNVRKTDGSDYLCDSLIIAKVHVQSKKEGERDLPPPPGSVFIDDLLEIEISNRTFFSSADSLSLISQYADIKKLAINADFLQKLNSISLNDAIEKSNKNERFRFHTISAPLFSKDRKKAYVQTGYHCGRLCGGGKAIYLQKINGTWKIMKLNSTWIS